MKEFTKRVRFETTGSGEIKASYADPPRHSREEFHAPALWWQRREFAQIKLEAARLTRAIRDGDVEFANLRKFSYAKCLWKIYRASSKTKELTSMAKDDLSFWAVVAGSRRGLERLTIQEINLESDRKRNMAIGTVLHAQQKCRILGIRSQQRTELIRDSYQAHTIQAKRFSRWVAEADARVAAIYHLNKELRLATIINNDDSKRRYHRSDSNRSISSVASVVSRDSSPPRARPQTFMDDHLVARNAPRRRPTKEPGGMRRCASSDFYQRPMPTMSASMNRYLADKHARMDYGNRTIVMKQQWHLVRNPAA